MINCIITVQKKLNNQLKIARYLVNPKRTYLPELYLNFKNLCIQDLQLRNTRIIVKGY